MSKRTISAEAADQKMDHLHEGGVTHFVDKLQRGAMVFQEIMKTKTIDNPIVKYGSGLVLAASAFTPVGAVLFGTAIALGAARSVNMLIDSVKHVDDNKALGVYRDKKEEAKAEGKNKVVRGAKGIGSFIGCVAKDTHWGKAAVATLALAAEFVIGGSGKWMEHMLGHTAGHVLHAGTEGVVTTTMQQHKTHHIKEHLAGKIWKSKHDTHAHHVAEAHEKAENHIKGVFYSEGYAQKNEGFLSKINVFSKLANIISDDIMRVAESTYAETPNQKQSREHREKLAQNKNDIIYAGVDDGPQIKSTLKQGATI